MGIINLISRLVSGLQYWLCKDVPIPLCILLEWVGRSLFSRACSILRSPWRAVPLFYIRVLFEAALGLRFFTRAMVWVRVLLLARLRNEEPELYTHNSADCVYILM